MDTVLALSGGVDSVYCLWKYIIDNPNKKILIHHVRLKHFQERLNYELEAVHNVLKWLDDNGYKNNYKYIESGLDYGDIKYVHYDIVSAAYYTGVILRNPIYKDIKYIIGTANKEEAATEDMEELLKAKRRVIRENLIKLLSGREDLEITYPICKIKKIDLVKEMPEDLFKLTWYCRKANEEGKPCGVCFTCCRVEGKPYRGRQKETFKRK